MLEGAGLIQTFMKDLGARTKEWWKDWKLNYGS